jgi:predicted RNA-binding protein with PUA-like domain
MTFWLLKTEPGTYGFPDLQRDRRTRWDGVTNAQAQAHLRAMRRGDGVAIYHSGAKEAVGLARVARAAYPDPGDASGRRVAVDVAAGAPLPRPVALAELQEEPAFAGSPLLRQGRLSVVPLDAAQWKALARRARRPASLGE